MENTSSVPEANSGETIGEKLAKALTGHKNGTFTAKEAKAIAAAANKQLKELKVARTAKKHTNPTPTLAEAKEMIYQGIADLENGEITNKEAGKIGKVAGMVIKSEARKVRIGNR